MPARDAVAESVAVSEIGGVREGPAKAEADSSQVSMPAANEGGACVSSAPSSCKSSSTWAEPPRSSRGRASYRRARLAAST
eukprot:2961511-Pyramimonas_sp.AAC.1